MVWILHSAHAIVLNLLKLTMRTISKFLNGAVLAVAALSSHASPVFVGSWNVGDGPVYFPETQPAYSGLEAAALLFGGDASDYVISTIDALVANIDNMAWYDGYGIGLGKLAEDFDNGAEYTLGIRSAYILDNSCNIRYFSPTSPCLDGFVNYAFRITDAGEVPEPASLALVVAALGGVVFIRRRNNKNT